MSDLDNAINSINASAAKAENTATFLDDMSTFDDQSSVTNPNNGQTVASIPKQVKDRTDELFTAAESDINQAVSDAAQSATDAQDAADSIGRYQGLWPDTGGSADKGDTYQTQVSGTPTGQYFTALQNTTVDPVGDDVNWRVVVSDKSLGGFTNYQWKNITSIVNFDHSVGDVIQTSGYNNEFDRGGSVYIITDDTDGVDGYGEFRLINGLTARFLNPRRAFSPDEFGVQRSNDNPLDQARYDAWLEFVHGTEGAWFTGFTGGSYIIYRGLIFRKSFIGDPNTVRFLLPWQYAREVLSETETTPDGRFDFNVSAVIGINPFTSTDTDDRFEFKNITATCTNNSSQDAADYGIWFPYGTSFEIDNIVIVDPKEWGFYVTGELWGGVVKRLNVFNAAKNGCQFSVGTHMTIETLYMHGSSGTGGVPYRFNNMVYSSIKNLAADGYDGAQYLYGILSCWGCNFSGLGSEHCSYDDAFYIGDSNITIDGVFLDNSEASNSVVNIFSASTVNFRAFRSRDLTRTGSARFARILTSGTTFNSDVPARWTWDGESSPENTVLASVNKVATTYSTITYSDTTPTSEEMGIGDKVWSLDEKKLYMKDNALGVIPIAEPLQQAYSSASRPVSGNYFGRMIFDSTLQKPLWYISSGVWKDADGVTV
ncbi:coil containing protein [Vibrio phage 1.248.O._10N.261.54.F1]|nr:coil containing protein [Vibrio phage 1.248.O._10N.261.54.F1]